MGADKPTIVFVGCNAFSERPAAIANPLAAMGEFAKVGSTVEFNAQTVLSATARTWEHHALVWGRGEVVAYTVQGTDNPPEALRWRIRGWEDGVLVMDGIDAPGAVCKSNGLAFCTIHLP